MALEHQASPFLIRSARTQAARRMLKKRRVFGSRAGRNDTRLRASPRKRNHGRWRIFREIVRGFDRHFLHFSGNRACEALAASSHSHRSRRFHGLGDAIFALRTRLPAAPKPSRCDFSREGVVACPSVDRLQRRPCLDRSAIRTEGLVADRGPPCSGQLDWEIVAQDGSDSEWRGERGRVRGKG